MSFAKPKWHAEMDARIRALAERAKRPGFDPAVTVRYVEPSKAKRGCK